MPAFELLVMVVDEILKGAVNDLSTTRPQHLPLPRTEEAACSGLAARRLLSFLSSQIQPWLVSPPCYGLPGTNVLMTFQQGSKNVFMILLRDPDWTPNSAGHPHGLKTIPVFPRRLTATEGRSLQIVNTF
jgi:hypothetical protein